MDIRTQFDWFGSLLAPLSDEQIGKALGDNEPAWEYIDSEMIKFGSLSHGALDVEEIQRQALQLLRENSKDFRLVVHLLRTLQHAGNAAELILAMELLTEYIKNYWEKTWPTKLQLKRRLAQQVLKRFDSAQNSFIEQASKSERDDAQGALAHLAQCWHANEPDLAKEVDQLRVRYNRQPEAVPVETKSAPAAVPASSSAESMAQTPQGFQAAPMPEVDVNSSSEKAWKQTLITVADLLCERYPELPVGYSLRRHAVWHTITTAPMANATGKTPLAPASADRTADYLARLPLADNKLLQQIEQSLMLAPYWLDGHAIAAQAALQLGYGNVAQAIRDELNAFLKRLPVLKTLSFSDMSAFISPETLDWLTLEPVAMGKGSVSADQEVIWQCFQQQGLEAALKMLEEHQQQLTEPRDQFYGQLLNAQLLEEAGMTALAQQHYRNLLHTGQHMQLIQWEPSLLALLAEKLPSPLKDTASNRSVNP
ncbi:type VI secretion system protein TssA [Xenorhabdus ehlersii]|uniref:Putative type VI secretion system protein n=1 Tax=Xenorhabdus ehlersii TaxID=290111 RepID=A0A2D0IUI8_9GAMM|nr:type VI secretion system protein TssA [Xenorhabdus ehlersii]PHM25536.1 putative type VI secretion system protein [Xenorhabdus ehlersii]RKE87381.1 type VI secretion system protein VasJ [Xenorhabdus ehlersii]